MRMLRIAVPLVFTFVLSSLAIAAGDAKSVPKEAPNFDVHGISMTECQCTAFACPCRSNGHPDHGSCDAADFTYIQKGRYGKVDMGGFKAVVVGDLIDRDASKVQGTVYFDKSSTPASGKHSMKCSRSCSDGTRPTLLAHGPRSQARPGGCAI